LKPWLSRQLQAACHIQYLLLTADSGVSPCCFWLNFDSSDIGSCRPMRAWDEDENDEPPGGVVCSRAVKAAMREADRLADRAERNELAQISERLLENPAVRHFLLTFEEQDWPDLLPCIASIGIQALTMHYGRAAQLSLGSLRTLAKWIERYRVWPSNLDMMSRTGSPASARRRLRSQSTGRAPLPEGFDTEAVPTREPRDRDMVPGTPPASCAILKPALTGIRARDQIRGRSPPPPNAQWSPRSSPRASPAGATLPWPSRRDEAFGLQAAGPNVRCGHCETEHLPDSQFCRICGCQRDAHIPLAASPLAPPGWEAMRETQSLPSREPLASFANYSGPEMAYGPGLPTPPLQPVPATQPSMDSATQPAIPAIPTIPVPLVQPLQSPITPPTPPTSISFAEVPPVQPLPPVTPPQPQVVPPASSSPMSPYPKNPTPPLTLPQPVISAPSNPPSARAWEPSPRGVPDAPRWRAREGAMSSRNDRVAPTQDEWYQTLMSRLRRLGEASSPRERPGVPGEPVTGGYASQNLRPPMRSASRDALNAKLRELGLERDGVATALRPEQATSCQGAGVGAVGPPGMLLNDLPDRALRRDSHSAAMVHPRREELLF